MNILWFLSPIVFASEDDCVNLSPHVTDEECANLKITMEFADLNENCTEALFKEKYQSLDSAFAVVVGESFTAIRQKQKETVWWKARREAEAMHQDEDDFFKRLSQVVETTTRKLEKKSFELSKITHGNILEVEDKMIEKAHLLQNATEKLSRTQNALQTLSESMREFSQLHNLYVAIRARSNRVHRCNAELRRVNANLMIRGTATDGEKALRECENLIGEDLTQELRETSAAYCSGSPREHPRRRLRANAVERFRVEEWMTTKECLREANSTDLHRLREHEYEDPSSGQLVVELIRSLVERECRQFSQYLQQYIMWRSSIALEHSLSLLSAVIDVVDKQSSSIAVSADTCSSEARSVYRKFKVNAENLAKGQACGKKMTERWKENVKECLEANKWKSVWLPWYNLHSMIGENNNCVQTHNILVGCLVTTLATVVAIFSVVSCLWRACNCTWPCFRCSKPQRCRRRKYVSDSEITDDSSDEEYERCQHAPKARKPKDKSKRDEKKTRKHKEGSKNDKNRKKAKKEKKNKKDWKDGKKDKKKNEAESVRDDRQEAQGENSRNPEAEIKIQWWRGGEQSLSSNPIADCELGQQAAGDTEQRLQSRAATIRAEVQSSKDGCATVLKNTHVHRLPNVASTSANDHISLARDQCEVSRDTHLYQHGAGPMTERSSSSECEMNGPRSVVDLSPTKNGRQSIENDLEAPGHLFHLPNLFPKKGC